jgi:hypothetical protein
VIHKVPKPRPKKKQAPPRLRRSKITKRRTVKRFAKRRDDAYRYWIRKQKCVIRSAWEFFGNTRGMLLVCGGIGDRQTVEPAHLKTRGAGGDDRNNLVALCPKHHDEQEGKTAAFEKLYSVNLKELAVAYTQRYVAEQGDPQEESRG